MVKRAIPLALGDSWKGHRIVGAGREYAEHYGASLSAGRFYEKPMEAVLGAEVAARSGAGVGATFKGAHGLGGEGDEHEDAYTVVGVLARSNSVIDRLVLTSIESVWQLHEEHQQPKDEAREVTVVLVQYASPLAAATLPRQINSQSELQAASPRTRPRVSSASSASASMRCAASPRCSSLPQGFRCSSRSTARWKNGATSSR
jgi:putative ABC transport system permease protein